MLELAPFRWVLAVAATWLVGVSKTGIPGLGVLAVPLFAEVLPARASTGALLPLLIVGDVFAVTFWHRHAVWRHLVRLLPWSIAGVAVGWFAMGRLDDAIARRLLGAMLLVIIAVSAGRDLRAAALRSRGIEATPRVPTHWLFAAAMGLAGGVATMITNAAGAILILYLLAMRLPKEAFIGTSAWYFLIVNCLKVPFSASLGFITSSSLLLDAALAGFVVAGSLAGLVLVKRLPERAFAILVQILAAASAIRMLC